MISNIPILCFIWVSVLLQISTLSLHNIYKMVVSLINSIKKEKGLLNNSSYQLLMTSSRGWFTCITWKRYYIGTWRVRMSWWERTGRWSCVILDFLDKWKKARKTKPESAPISGWLLRWWETKRKLINMQMFIVLVLLYGNC